MKWYEVQYYHSIEISEKGDVRGKPYSIFRGNQLIQRKGRWKKVNRKNEVFIRENGIHNMVRIDSMKRGKVIS